jgi:hypothetical protein
LWNWFATGALHVPEISFWMMYGLVLTIGAFKMHHDDSNIEQKNRLKAIAIAVDASMPEDKRKRVRERLDDQQNGIWDDILIAFAKNIHCYLHTRDRVDCPHVLL